MNKSVERINKIVPQLETDNTSTLVDEFKAEELKAAPNGDKSVAEEKTVAGVQGQVRRSAAKQETA
jgi:uncharacterized membrane-anchored protein